MTEVITPTHQFVRIMFWVCMALLVYFILKSASGYFGFALPF